MKIYKVKALSKKLNFNHNFLDRKNRFKKFNRS